MGESPPGALDPARWRRVRDVFDVIVELEPSERLARLESACAGDPALFREVKSLLDHDDRSSHDPIERILVQAAQDTVAARDAIRPTPTAIGRYRIVSKLGEGGMGEVFLAEDTTLGRRVALKLPAAPLAGDRGARERLQREARAAATLNHPHVCVVHEVGEGPDGQPFIAMEHLEGETLAARLARGRLPFADVITLGRQAADALADAHGRGVVHRDLKPSNIMMTPHGVKLLDFGLASLALDLAHASGAHAPDAGPFMGTIRYMSPEQARGEPLDRRTDLFSLGIVLYEAATGRLPFDGDTPRAVRAATLHAMPAPPSRIVGKDLPAAFDRIVTRALAKDPGERYADAGELSADLARLAPGTRRNWMAWAGGAAAAAIFITLAIYTGGIAGRTVAPAPSSTPATPASTARAKPTVLVAGISNTTGDASFDGTLRLALMVQLQQTPFLDIFPDSDVRETLRLMARPADEPLTAHVAKEIAVRRAIPVWIAGSIAPSPPAPSTSASSPSDAAGERYAITLAATGSVNGDVLARAHVTVVNKAEVLPGLGRAILELRQRLGESAPTIQQFSTPIERATTASLDALKAYALGVDQSRRGDYATAASLYARAVEIDPDFAMAHMALAREEMNSNHSARMAAAATRAFELRERVTPTEGHRIAVFYHSSVTGDLDQALAAASQWQQASGRPPYNILTNLYWSVGDFGRALGTAREALKLFPDVAPVHSNVAGALYGLGRFDEAREVYRQAMARGLDAPEYHAYSWRIAFHQGDDEAMRQHLEWAEASSTWVRNILARPAAFRGRWRDAQAATAKAVAFFDARGMTGLGARAMSYEAMDAALFGDCRVARRAAPRVLTSALAEEQAQAMMVMALCGERVRALVLAEALRAKQPSGTRLTRIWLPSIHAAAALAAGDPKHAVELLRVTTPYDGATEPWPVYLRGLALLRAGNGAEARAAFERILNNPGWSFWEPFAPLSHLGRARAAAMTGDVETAKRAYQEFVTLWRDADADLPVLVAARREYARLALAR